LGGGAFVERVLKEAQEKAKRPYRTRERKKSVKELIAERCRDGHVSVQELRAGSRRGVISRVRAEIAGCLVDRYGLPLAEVARQVGVSTSAISKTLRKTEYST
jgi:hypothetical protein